MTRLLVVGALLLAGCAAADPYTTDEPGAGAADAQEALDRISDLESRVADLEDQDTIAESDRLDLRSELDHAESRLSDLEIRTPY